MSWRRFIAAASSRLCVAPSQPAAAASSARSWTAPATVIRPILPAADHGRGRRLQIGGLVWGIRKFGGDAAAAAANDGEEWVEEVRLAQTGEGIAECELLKWFVEEGECVEEFQRLCEVQSDKATIEITSRYKGKVHQIQHVPGDIVKVGELLLTMLVRKSQPESHSENDSLPTEVCLVDTPKKFDEEAGKVLSTPSVRHLAKKLGIDIEDVHGSGDAGRVLKEDVLKCASAKGIKELLVHTDKDKIELHSGDKLNTKVTTKVHVEDRKIPLRGYQRAMVKTMNLAAKVPHFHYLEEINCDALIEVKEALESAKGDDNIKITFLSILIKSLSVALSKHPLLNSSFIQESNEVILKGCHNIGVAMATTHGLVVPNIKNVQSLSIFEIAKELGRLQFLATGNMLTVDDISGGTITLSNIGAIGGKFGSPLVNVPEVAIIALGRVEKVPRFDDDENVYPASISNVTIGADHRVIDGATVAQFCNEWKCLIENPELLLLNLR